jgi:hypothetical protein
MCGCGCGMQEGLDVTLRVRTHSFTLAFFDLFIVLISRIARYLSSFFSPTAYICSRADCSDARSSAEISHWTLLTHLLATSYHLQVLHIRSPSFHSVELISLCNISVWNLHARYVNACSCDHLPFPPLPIPSRLIEINYADFAHKFRDGLETNNEGSNS